MKQKNTIVSLAFLEGLVNANLDKGMTWEWAEENAEAVIDRYAGKPAGGYADWESALFRKATQQASTMSNRIRELTQMITVVLRLPRWLVAGSILSSREQWSRRVTTECTA